MGNASSSYNIDESFDTKSFIGKWYEIGNTNYRKNKSLEGKYTKSGKGMYLDYVPAWAQDSLFLQTYNKQIKFVDADSGKMNMTKNYTKDDHRFFLAFDVIYYDGNYAIIVTDRNSRDFSVLSTKEELSADDKVFVCKILLQFKDKNILDTSKLWYSIPLNC